MTQCAEITYRPARAEDLPAIAEVFAAAFPQSVSHVAGELPQLDILSDLFGMALRAEPASLRVAECAGRVAGYILAPARLSRLRRAALLHGLGLRILWRWLWGHYGVRGRALLIAAQDKLAFLRGERRFGRGEARIFSVGVHPDFQGRGLGGGLLQAGLAYLESQGVPQVRLEVRPDNAPAVHLYEKTGFVARVEYADGQGSWLVMVKPMAGPVAPGRKHRRSRAVAAAALVTLGLGMLIWSGLGFLANRPVYLANLRLRLTLPTLDTPGSGDRVLLLAPTRMTRRWAAEG